MLVFVIVEFTNIAVLTADPSLSSVIVDVANLAPVILESARAAVSAEPP